MYKKIDFNIPILLNDGTPQMRTRYDQKKLKALPDGRMTAEPILDAEGFVAQEPSMLNDLLCQLIDNVYKGEDALGYSDRLARGKLARKISDKTSSSRKNYQDTEMALLKDCLVKGQASPVILSIVDDLITSEPPEENSKQPDPEKAPAAPTA